MSTSHSKSGSWFVSSSVGKMKRCRIGNFEYHLLVGISLKLHRLIWIWKIYQCQNLVKFEVNFTQIKKIKSDFVKKINVKSSYPWHKRLPFFSKLKTKIKVNKRRKVGKKWPSPHWNHFKPLTESEVSFEMLREKKEVAVAFQLVLGHFFPHPFGAKQWGGGCVCPSVRLEPRRNKWEVVLPF